MDLYTVAKQEATKIAPSLTDDQLSERIRQADEIVATSLIGRKRYTIAWGARDAFRAEEERRRHQCEHGITFGEPCEECRLCGRE